MATRAATTAPGSAPDAAAPSPAGTARGPLLGLLLVIISACGFGSGPFFARAIVYPAGLDWLTLLAWRFLFGAALCWVWLLAAPSRRAALRSLTRRRVIVLIALGVLFTGNSGTYFAALETVPASLAALIVYIYPALVAVLAIRLGRRLTGTRAWVGLAFACAGVALSVGGIDPEAVPPVAGLVLAIASPVIYAVWIVLAARLGGERPVPAHASGAEAGAAEEATGAETASRVPGAAGGAAAEAAVAPEETDPAPASAIMLTATWAVWWTLATVTGREVTPAAVPPAAWPGLLGVGVLSTALAIQGFYAGAKRIGAANAALVSTVEPVYTIAIATLFFAETLTPVQIAGGALVISGVLLAQTAPDAPLRSSRRSEVARTGT